MAKPLEETLAEYVLGLQPGTWMRPYFRSCLVLWREKYGETVTQRVVKIVKDRRRAPQR